MLLSRPLTVPVLGFVLGSALMAAGCDRQSGDKAQQHGNANPSAAAPVLAGIVDRTHRGAPLPAVTVKDPEGKTLALAGLKGPLLLNLWATWCGPCVTELPMLDRLSADRGGKLRVVTVSEDMGDGAKVRAFLAGKGLAHLPAWLDPANDLAFAYGGGNLPTTIYYDAAGHEVWRMTGGHDWSGPDTAGLLDEGK